MVPHPFKKKKKNSPPSPPKLPIIGSLHQIGLQPHRSLQAIAQHHDPLMLLHFDSVPTLVVSSANAAQEITKTHNLIFMNRPKSSMFEKLSYNYKDMKSILVLHLLSRKRIQSFRVVREEELSLLVEKIKQSCFSIVNLSEVLPKLTNGIICRVTLGRRYDGGEGRRKFKKLIEDLVELLGIINVGDYIPWLAWVSHANGLDAKVEKVAKQFDDFLEEVMEEHISCQKKGSDGHVISLDNEEQKDLVDILLWIQRENMIGFPIERDAFVGGTDTTYSVLEWAMTELLRHPRTMKKVQNEVRGITSHKKGITEDELEELQYLDAIIKETLRLHPTIPLLFPREANRDVQIQGYDIAVGTQVLINAWAIGRDPGLWDNPEEYQPKRFLNPTINFKGHDFQLIPFGAGRRGCLGICFAITTIKFILANLLHYFDWTLPSGARGENLDMTESIGISIHRKFPLTAFATPYFG
ncbi:hypothetical protein ACJW30_01G162300 [Castanea mollissima]